MGRFQERLIGFVSFSLSLFLSDAVSRFDAESEPSWWEIDGKRGDLMTSLLPDRSASIGSDGGMNEAITTWFRFLTAADWN